MGWVIHGVGVMLHRGGCFMEWVLRGVGASWGGCLMGWVLRGVGASWGGCHASQGWMLHGGG